MMSRWRLVWGLVWGLIISFAAVDSAAQTLGVMGDSMSDEFRADDQRGGSYGATTFNWLELLQRTRGVNVGAWGTRAEPRRTGYAHNWARSAAQACDLGTGGQTAGLQTQVDTNVVEWVIILAGGNDFTTWNGTYEAIYNGSLSGAALTTKINTVIGCLTAAMDAVAGVDDEHAFIATVLDLGQTASVQAQFPNTTFRQRVTDAITTVNTGITTAAAARGVIVMDLVGYGTQVLSQLDPQGNVVVGGELISAITPGDEPHHLSLADDNHIGTVGNGILLNYFLSFMNAEGFGVTPLTDAEMLQQAGISIAPATVFRLRFRAARSDGASGSLLFLVAVLHVQRLRRSCVKP